MTMSVSEFQQCGRVHLESEREREHRHGCEAGILQQLVEGEFDVVHGGIGSGTWRLGSGVLAVDSSLTTHPSLLSATIGSTCAARRAGNQQASKATPVSPTATLRKVNGSVACTE